MENWAKNAAQLKQFVKQNNIWMVEPSGKYGKLNKSGYLVSIKNYLATKECKSIIPCEWLLVGSIYRCSRPSVLGTKFYSLHQWRIRTGKPTSVPCRNVAEERKTNRNCARDAGGTSLINV